MEYTVSLPKPVYECAADDIKAWAERIYDQAKALNADPSLLDGYAEAVLKVRRAANPFQVEVAGEKSRIVEQTPARVRGVLAVGRPWWVENGTLVTVSMIPDARSGQYIMPMAPIYSGATDARRP